MPTTIIDCYSDEPSGLGVPPYLGTYPRYIAGMHPKGVKYLTIDDLRLLDQYDGRIPKIKKSQKTPIKVHNLTRNYQDVRSILAESKRIIVILGVHTPGKYLSAVPGSLREVVPLISGLSCEKILTGPAATEFGTQIEGGRGRERQSTEIFDKIIPYMAKDYDDIRTAAVKGASIIRQISPPRMIEIETGRGCLRMPGCSFCTEPLKQKPEWRDSPDIIKEIAELKKHGAEYFRLGKQACFLSYKGGAGSAIEGLLKPIHKMKPKVLHIDNVNPAKVTKENTEIIVKYCTPGNIASFGVESFDPKVIIENNLNSNPDMVHEAVKIINDIGGKRGEGGMHHYLPGINLIFGLIGESRQTFDINHEWLKRFYSEHLLIRRINIRKVVPFPGTLLYEKAGLKILRKNKRYYWKARNRIRNEIDFPMLKRLVPEGTVIKDARAEIYNGNSTFLRQMGTYPLVIGVKKRLELDRFYDIKVIGHMLRSIVGEVV
jgi:radical SAM superfamily enzyme with C-terminal helix-hairpin-helix motif